MDVDNLLYFEYHEDKNEKFKAKDFIAKYDVNPRFVDDTNVFTFLSGILEQDEFFNLCQWKKSLLKKRDEVSIYTLQIQTKSETKELNMTMIPMLDSQREKIEYFVGYFS